MESVGETAFWRSASARDGFLMECVGEGQLFDELRLLGTTWFDGGVGMGRLVSLSWKRRII